MKEVKLVPMTRELCHELFRAWENDASIYMDMSLFREYVYDAEKVDRYFDSRQESSRVVLAVMLEGHPIGEVQLKNIDREQGECTLSIHLQNDSVKGLGYGTEAERQAIRYAFEELGMSAINADTILKNIRSQHILEKLGFRSLGEKEGFVLYRLER